MLMLDETRQRKEVYGEKKKEKKKKNQSVAWYAYEASLRKERYDGSMNESREECLLNMYH